MNKSGLKQWIKVVETMNKIDQIAEKIVDRLNLRLSLVAKSWVRNKI